jgi:hypothetical protein
MGPGPFALNLKKKNQEESVLVSYLEKWGYFVLLGRPVGPLDCRNFIGKMEAYKNPMFQRRPEYVLPSS